MCTAQHSGGYFVGVSSFTLVFRLGSKRLYPCTSHWPYAWHFKFPHSFMRSSWSVFLHALVFLCDRSAFLQSDHSGKGCISSCSHTGSWHMPHWFRQLLCFLFILTLQPRASLRSLNSLGSVYVSSCHHRESPSVCLLLIRLGHRSSVLNMQQNSMQFGLSPLKIPLVIEINASKAKDNQCRWEVLVVKSTVGPGYCSEFKLPVSGPWNPSPQTP